VTTGIATIVDSVVDGGATPGIIGLAFTEDTGNDMLFALDSFGSDDLGLIDLDGGTPLDFGTFQTLAFANAGRGDLAAQIAAVPEPPAIAIWMLLGSLAVLTLWYRRGKAARA